METLLSPFFFFKKGIFSIDLSLAKAESDSFCIAKKKSLKKIRNAVSFLFVSTTHGPEHIFEYFDNWSSLSTSFSTSSWSCPALLAPSSLNQIKILVRMHFLVFLSNSFVQQLPSEKTCFSLKYKHHWRMKFWSSSFLSTWNKE